MIPKRLTPAPPDEVLGACKRFRQGQLIESPAIFTGDGNPLSELAEKVAEAIEDEDEREKILKLLDAAPDYGLVTSQTCNIWRADQQPWLDLAPVFHCTADDEILKDTGDFIVELAPPALPAADGVFYVDLRLEMPLHKEELVGRDPIEAYADEVDYLRLADVLARKKGRPALAAVFNELLNVQMKAMKRESRPNRRLLEGIRPKVYKLKLAIEEGTRLEPSAAKLYIVTHGDPHGAENSDVKAWFDDWWNRAREVAGEKGLELLPNGWLNANSLDAALYDGLVDVRSFEISPR